MTCLKCGFPLTRPRLKAKDGVCQACINSEVKKTIDFKARQEWLTKFIKENRGKDYDCVIAVSGGKDSHMIVRRLVERHGVKNALLVSVTDEFTHTKAGKMNIDNLVNRYGFDLITFRCDPVSFKRETLKDFQDELHPLKWVEGKIYEIPVKIAKLYGIPIVFFGENSAFEYGESEELDIFHPGSDDTKIIFMGAIYPYSITDSLQQAREIGFVDLDYTGEWPRQGSIEQYTQIDSVAYIIQLWTKFVKFGFQRVADIACRLVREGVYTREQAMIYIDKYDYICDPTARDDFCNTVGITRKDFEDIVDKHANKKLVEKVNGEWKTRKA